MELQVHGSLAECVAALASEVSLLRQRGLGRAPDAPVTPVPAKKMFPDRGVRVPLSR